MKAKLLSAVIAAVCANGAMALTPANLPADLELSIGGASAQDLGLREVVTSLCDDTVHSYSETGSIPGKDYTSFFCTMSSAKVPGFPAGGLKVLVHKRSRGGSAYGVGPVEANSSVAHAKVANDGTCTVFAGNNYKCTTTVSTTIDAGISDVEPGMFRGVNLLEVGVNGVLAGDPGTTPLTSTQLNRLDKAPVAALTFGPVVTTNLRNALQVAQFGAGNACVGADTEACMPSLSKTQIASLFAGTIANWDEFRVGNTPLSQVSGVIAPVATDVHVYRRVAGSGTQSVANYSFLNQPCSGNVIAAGDNTSGTNLAGVGDVDADGEYPAIHQASGSGDVDTGLASLNSTGHWGIGFQSLEKTNTGYRFVKVEGVAPTLVNVANTSYDIVGITSFQWIKDSLAGSPMRAPAPQAANKLILAKKLRADLGRDTELRTANLTFGGGNITGAVGNVGFAALASNGFTLNTPFDATKPVVAINNRGVLGTGDASSCSPALIIGGKSSLL
jgi:hypothetical protein